MLVMMIWRGLWNTLSSLCVKNTLFLLIDLNRILGMTYKKSLYAEDKRPSEFKECIRSIGLVDIGSRELNIPSLAILKVVLLCNLN